MEADPACGQAGGGVAASKPVLAEGLLCLFSEAEVAVSITGGLNHQGNSPVDADCGQC